MDDSTLSKAKLTNLKQEIRQILPHRLSTKDIKHPHTCITHLLDLQSLFIPK
jgi:hypothetical protein